MKLKSPQRIGRSKIRTTVTRLVDEATPAKFKLRLREGFFLRLHMLLILAGVVLAGVGTSKLLLAVGVEAMVVRYPLGVVVGYAVFFLLTRLWLWYVGAIASRKRRRASSGSQGDWGGPDLPDADVVGGADWSGFGGGKSGGGGASDSWGDATGSVSDGLVGDGWLDFGFDLDGDEGCLVLLLILPLLLLVLALSWWFLGSGFYLLYQAPAILTEAAFEAALVAGLVRASRRAGAGSWHRSLFKATWKQFVAVLVVAVAVGWAAQHFCPAAVKLADLWRACQ